MDRFNNRRYVSQILNANIQQANAQNIIQNQNDQQNVNNNNNNNANSFDANYQGVINVGFDGGNEFNANQILTDADEDPELSDEFKQNYESWLQEEVYAMDINWDLLKSDLSTFEVK